MHETIVAALRGLACCGGPALERKGRLLKRIIVVISSASGAIFGIRALQALKEVPLVETRLVLSPKAKSGISLMTTA